MDVVITVEKVCAPNAGRRSGQCCQLAEISAAKHKSGPKKILAAGQISGRIFYKISKKWQKRGRTFSEACSEYKRLDFYRNIPFNPHIPQLFS
jgi:hypothetical protein